MLEILFLYTLFIQTLKLFIELNQCLYSSSPRSTAALTFSYTSLWAEGSRQQVRGDFFILSKQKLIEFLHTKHFFLPIYLRLCHKWSWSRMKYNKIYRSADSGSAWSSKSGIPRLGPETQLSCHRKMHLWWNWEALWWVNFWICKYCNNCSQLHFHKKCWWCWPNSRTCAPVYLYL